MTSFEIDHSFRPVVVLSGPLDSYGQPHPDDTMRRIDLGIEIASLTNNSLFSVGGCAEQLRTVAIKRGLHPERVIATGDFRDTVGNAINIREEVVDFLGAQAMYLVTADYHMPRASSIFHRVMPEVEIIEASVETGYSPQHKRIQKFKERTIRSAVSALLLRGYDPESFESINKVRSKLEKFAATRNKLERAA